MRIAVMADIHSNSPAFHACLMEAERRGCTEFLFLGDYLGDMACPQETLGMLRQVTAKYPCTLIRGNKEEYWIRHRQHPEEKWEYGNSATGMLRYNMDHLRDEDIDFFETLPISRMISRPGYPEFVICHGSPFRVDQSLREDHEGLEELMDAMPARLVICGHFHIQTEYWKKGVHVINPGSVGVPLHSGGKAQFMVLEGEQGAWKIEFVTLGYDVHETIRKMDREELGRKAPCWYRMTKDVIRTGLFSQNTVVLRLLEEQAKAGGKAELAAVPEAVWQRVLDEVEDAYQIRHANAEPSACPEGTALVQ